MLVVVAPVLYDRNIQRSIETRAAGEFTQLQATIASGNTELAIRDLRDFVGRFGSSEPGRQARIILAEILLYEGQHAEAVEALGGLERDLDEPMGTAAARIRAAAHEAQGEVDEAVSLYLGIAEAARFDFQAREALGNAARVRLQAGDAADAAALYQRAVDTFEPDEAGRGYYEMWLAEARARAESGGAVAAPAAAETMPVSGDSAGG